jgi:hypothetical protein
MAFAARTLNNNEETLLRVLTLIFLSFAVVGFNIALSFLWYYNSKSKKFETKVFEMWMEPIMKHIKRNTETT